MQGTTCIPGSVSGPFVVSCYVRAEDEVTSSSKTPLGLKFNPGVCVLRAKISPFTASSAAIFCQTNDFCGWENANLTGAEFTLGGPGFLRTSNNQFCLYRSQRARY